MNSLLLHTKLLYLRPCQMTDLDSLYELAINSDVRRFLFDDRQVSRDEVKRFVDQSIATFAKFKYGLWLFFEHQNDLIAGFAGLLHFERELPSLIFATRPQLWKRGYATQAALSILDYAFNVIALERIIADVDEANKASIKVLEKLGMSQTRRAIVNGQPLIYYEIKDELLPDGKRFNSTEKTLSLHYYQNNETRINH